MRFPESKVLLLQLVVFFGLWRESFCCNTNKAECDKLMNDAMEFPTAEQICTGMQKYLDCVQKDLADCTDNRLTDQYALNMVKTYCNKAYICSDRLQRCYQNFTQSVMQRITNSNNETRAQLCGTLVTPIMTCQEQVTSDCHDQTGLLETVASQQDSLNAACSDTVPCLGKILQCQSTIIDLVPGGELEVPSQDQPSDCSSQNTVDYCGAYRKALQCMKSNLTTCTEKFKVDSIVASLENTTGTVCDPKATCMQNVSTCLCHINSAGSRGHASIMTSICTTYPPFAHCMGRLAPECDANSEVSTQVDALNSSYYGYHRVFCTRDEGMCPPAVQCLANLSLPQTASQSSLSSDALSVQQMCYSAEPVLKCLGSASSQCEEKKGNVTFKQIEENFLDMCVEIAPHVQTLSRCSSFEQCMKNYDLVDLGLSASTGNTQADVVKVMKQMYSGLTKTDFWCKYLTHGYKCIADEAQACSLEAGFVAESRQKYLGIARLCGGAPPVPPKGPTDGNSGTGDNGNQGTNVGGTKDTDDGGNGVSSHHAVNTNTILAAVTSVILLLRHHRQ